MSGESGGGLPGSCGWPGAGEDLSADGTLICVSHLSLQRAKRSGQRSASLRDGEGATAKAWSGSKPHWNGSLRPYQGIFPLAEALLAKEAVDAGCQQPQLLL